MPGRHRSWICRHRWGALRALALLASLAGATPASGQFLVDGKRVGPTETNFAGVRQISPLYGFVVQINHDARLDGDLDLGLIDDVFAKLQRDHRGEALVAPTRLVVVITTGAKIAKFGEAGQRRIFRWLEPDLRKHRDFHVSPVAIFIADQVAADREKLEAVLSRALSLYFDPRLKEALDSVDTQAPGGAPHRGH